MAYPQLDKNMIDIALRFDEKMQSKYGPDYKWEDHKDELLPKDLEVDLQKTVEEEHDREGEDSQAGTEV